MAVYVCPGPRLFSHAQKAPDAVGPDSERLDRGLLRGYYKVQIIQSQVLRPKWRMETVGKAVHYTDPEGYCTDINLALGRKTRTTEGSEWVAVEHRGTRVRAGALGEESFSSSPKVTAR